MTLDFSDLIAIIALLVSIYTIYQNFQFIYPRKISLINISLEELKIELINNFKNINIKKGKNKIENNLYYFKSLLINHGAVDIEKSKNENPIKIIFPNDIKIISCEINESSQDLEYNLIVNNENEVIIEFDYFKKNEFIILEFLIRNIDENKDVKEFLNEIKTSHRLLNTSKISYFPKMLNKENKKGKLILLIKMSLLLFIIGYLFLNELNLFHNKIYYSKNQIEKINNKKVINDTLYTVKAITNNKLLVNNNYSKFSEDPIEVDLKYFNDNFKIKKNADNNIKTIFYKMDIKIFYYLLIFVLYFFVSSYIAILKIKLLIFTNQLKLPK